MKEEKEKIERQEKNKKKKKQSIKNTNADPMKNVIIFGFIIITVIFIIITLVVFNIFNIKDKLSNKVVETLLSDKLSIEILKLEDEYNTKYEKLFNIQVEKINKKEQDLYIRENDLNNKKQEIENNKLEIEKTLLEIKEKEKIVYGISKDIIEISKVIGKMKSDNAANILSKMEDKDLVRDIIFNLKEDQAAAILENIDPSIAAKITQGRYKNGFNESDD